MSKSYKYMEAFNLMLYKCDSCGAMEVLWNSRDGVTPFGIKCRFCHVEGEFPAMSHIAWQLDSKNENYKPFIGQRIFIGNPEEPKVKLVAKEE